MTMVPEVHGALRAAVARGAARRRRRIPRTPLAISLVAGLAISGTAIAATGAWRPVLGVGGAHPQPAPRPLASDLRNGLAVLARPQTAADRGAAVQAVLKYGLFADRNRPHLGDVRLLATHDGGAAVLVPMNHVNYRHPNLPRRDRLCVLYSRTFDAWQHPATLQSCGNLGQLRAGEITSWMPHDYRRGTATFLSGLRETHQWGLVPDGVTRVKVTFYGKTTAWATVRDNFYDATSPRTTRTVKMTQWFAADGSEVVRPSTSDTKLR